MFNLEAILTANGVGAVLMIILLISSRMHTRSIFLDEKIFVLMVWLTLSLCAVSFLSRFVLTIQVTGNQEIPTAVILSQLRQQGIRPGGQDKLVQQRSAVCDIRF